MKTLVFIPARGGSKSIPMKNLALFDEEPLLGTILRLSDWVKGADVVVSTDSPAIAAYAGMWDVKIHHRPPKLSDDDSNVFYTFRNWWMENSTSDAHETCVFLQPTYPFIKKWHIDACLSVLGKSGDSAQTIIPVPHDFHEYNQREIDADVQFVNFVNEAIREDCYNKQRKPTRYAFGGVLVFNIQQALDQGTLFPTPSTGVHIPPLPVHDVDNAADLALANLLRREGVV